MGRLSRKRLIILVTCLLLTGVATYSKTPTGGGSKAVTLHEALGTIDGWSYSGSNLLDSATLASLKLDDYVYNYYSRGAQGVSLYIGYYRTAEKVGAVHDPLVCFPGQGWVLSDGSKGTLDLNSPSLVRYSTVIAQRGLDRYLVVYWFQSYDDTSSDTFWQKIRSLREKVFRGKQDNAFVRIMARVDGNSLRETNEAVVEFIRAFYPVFLRYVKAA
jgi:EpsI family protein